MNKDNKIIHNLIIQIDKNPYNPQNYYNLGTVLTQAQNFEQAEELYKRALNVFENRAEDIDILHYGLGNLYYESGLYDEAQSEFKLVTNTQLKKDAFLMLAQSFYAKEDYQKAIVYALTVADKFKDYYNGYKLMADSFLAMGQLDNAKEYYQKAKRKHATKEVLFNLGLIHFTQGSREQADEYFTEVKNLDKDYYQKMSMRLNDLQKVISKK